MKIALSARPESFWKLIGRSFHIYRVAFRHVFLLALVLTLISFTPRLISIAVGQDIFWHIHVMSYYNLWLVAIDFVSLTFFTALLWRVRCVITDEHETLTQDMHVALRKIPHIFVASVLQSVLIMTVILLFGLIFYYFLYSPGIIHANSQHVLLTCGLFFIQFVLVIYLFFAFYFYLPIILVENRGVLDALTKSASLVWGNWWRTFRLQLTPWISYLILLVFIRYLMVSPPIFTAYNTVSMPSLSMTILHILAFTLIVPWVAILLLIQMHDLELRKEQVWDYINSPSKDLSGESTV